MRAQLAEEAEETRAGATRERRYRIVVIAPVLSLSLSTSSGVGTSRYPRRGDAGR